MPREARGAVQVVLKLSKSVPKLIQQMEAVLKGMGERTDLFPDPPVALSVVGDHVGALLEAQVATQTRHVATFPVRNDAVGVVRREAEQLRAYVDGKAVRDPTRAEMYAGAAAMQLRKFGGRVVLDIIIKQVRSGAVLAVARTIPGAKSYEWELSMNQGETWTRLSVTTRARCPIELAPGSFIMVRVRAVTKDGPTPWRTSRPFAVS